MSTITLLTVLQVINDRKTDLLKDLERIDTDNRVKNKDTAKPAIYARIDECDKIYQLLDYSTGQRSSENRDQGRNQSFEYENQ